MIKKLIISLITIITVFSLISFGCDKTTATTASDTAEEESKDQVDISAEEKDEEEEEVTVASEEESNIPPEGLVTFTTEDGIEISGTVHGTGNRWVILSHMYPTDQTSWSDFARELAAKGYIVLTYDFRGYGKSGGSKDIPNIHKDLEATLNFVRQYDGEKVFLIGASMGGAASLIVASKEEVDGVICFSSDVEFMGLSAAYNVKDIKCPKLFMASQGDVSAANAANQFFEDSSKSKYLVILNGSAHGTFIFQEEPEEAETAKQNMYDFLDSL